MKFLLIVLLLTMLLVQPLDAAPRKGCVIDFYAYTGFHWQPAGLRVFFDTDQAWSITSEDLPVQFTVPVDAGLRHVINVFTDNKHIWSGGFVCEMPTKMTIYAHFPPP